jgi:hypothetical protein
VILPFSQLEFARKNPAKFGKSYAPGPGKFNSRNFRTFLSTAISQFHRGATKQEVISEFSKKCEDRLKLQAHFQPRLTHYVKILNAYCDSYSSQGCQFVEVKKPTKLVIGSHMLRGRIDRFDMRISGGYRATITQLDRSQWEDELRWPLIQKAIADELGASTGEIEVGVFYYEDASYSYRVFSDADIAAAEKEALTVLSEIEKNLLP